MTSTCPGQVELFRQRPPAPGESAAGARLHRRRQRVSVDHAAGGLDSETGWWFGCHEFYFPINIGFMSSSQLTKSYFSEGWPWPTNQESLAAQFVFQPGVHHLVPLAHDARGGFNGSRCFSDLGGGSHDIVLIYTYIICVYIYISHVIGFPASFPNIFSPRSPRLPFALTFSITHSQIMFNIDVCFVLNHHKLSLCIVYIHHHVLAHKTRTLIYWRSATTTITIIITTIHITI